MAAIDSCRENGNPFVHLDPLDLQLGLHKLMEAYQASRSALRAWLVVHYAEAICEHPDFEGSDEQRCAYRRMARQWRWLAREYDIHQDAQVPGLAS